MAQTAVGKNYDSFSDPESTYTGSDDLVDDHLLREFKDTMFEVTYDSFVKAFLYPPSSDPATESSIAKGYASVANKLLHQFSTAAAATSDCQSTDTNQQSTLVRIHSSTTGHPVAIQPDVGAIWYEEKAFYPLRNAIAAAEANPKLKTAELREQKLYGPLIALMTAIRDFYRENGLSGDENWPQPINPDPRPGARQPTRTNPHLTRNFVGCYSRPLDFVSEMVAEPDLKPDLALVLVDDEATPTDDDTYVWKDVDVGIEVKFDTVFDAKTITQVARYARAMKIDQPDRNFFYTLLISKDTCRVFRWDSAGCYVTEPLWYHQKPEKFIELIGRLAALDPETLGFDLSFSNAGRVHSSHDPDSMRTTLTILPAAVRDLVERDNNGRITIPKPFPADTLEDQKAKVFVLSHEPVSRIAIDYNFGRSTIVWEGWEVIKGQARQGRRYIIKQNYQDDTRPHEGSFYVEGNKIKGVGHLAFSQELEHTREYRQRIASSDITGCWRKVQPTQPTPKTAEKPPTPPAPETPTGMTEDGDMDRHRRPLREKMGWVGGRKRRIAAPSSTAKGTKVNSEATPQWKLERSEKAPKVERVLLRFVFEDVGENLSETRDAMQLIDVASDCLQAIRELWEAGILHRDISFGNLLMTTRHPLRGFVIDLGLAMWIGKDGKAQGGSDVHHHLTGTLPFIAASLLPEDCDPRPPHAVGHDIESLFWVLLWTCLTFSGMAQPTCWMVNTLDNLNGADPATVGSKKSTLLLSPHLIHIEGKYHAATAFLQAFARLCQSPKTRTFDAATKIFDDFKHNRLDPPEGVPELEQPGSPTTGPSQLKRTLDDQCDDGPRSKRSRGG